MEFMNVFVALMVLGLGILIPISLSKIDMKHATAEEIFGDLDAMKVKSCMTLFDIIRPEDIFSEVLRRFYGNTRCEITIAMLSKK